MKNLRKIKKSKFLLSYLGVLSLLFSGTNLLALPKNNCTGKSWSLNKKAATFGAAKTRKFYLKKHALIWCDANKKFIGKTDYYKMTEVTYRSKDISISLNQKDRGRGPDIPIKLSSKNPREVQEFSQFLGLKIKQSLEEYNCNRNPSWTFKKKGATIFSRTMTRKIYLGKESVYWCQGSTPKGYNPYLKMGKISNTDKQIKIELISEHRGRGKDNALILYPLDQLQIVKFIAALQKKKEESYNRYVSSILSPKKTSNDDRLLKTLAKENITAKQKLRIAVEKAKIIGKGLNKLTKQGIKGKVLDELYWREALAIFHFFANNRSPVAYLSNEKSRRPFRVFFKKDPVDNHANLTRGNLANTFNTADHSTAFSKQGYAIFVISPEKIMYSGSHSVGQFHHSSFLAGSAVLSAGEIKTNAEGEIVWFSNKSGHYQPGMDQVVNALKFFKSKGVDLSKVVFKNMMRTEKERNAQEVLDANK